MNPKKQHKTTNTQTPTVGTTPLSGVSSTEVNESMGIIPPQSNDSTSWFRPVKLESITNNPGSTGPGTVVDLKQVDTDIKNNELYNDLYNSLAQRYHVGEDVHGTYTEMIKERANEVSPYYKMYADTGYLPLLDSDWNDLAAQYESRKTVYGAAEADKMLNDDIKRIVASNQSGLEKVYNALGGFGADLAGMATMLTGMITGAVTAPFTDEREGLNNWESFVDKVLDNQLTRDGHNMMEYGIFRPKDIVAAREGNLELNKFEIVNTPEQEELLISANTPFEVLQQGGFTAFTMLEGRALAAMNEALFKGVGKSIMKGSLKRAAAQEAAEAAATLQKANAAITTLARVENGLNAFAVPAFLGMSESVVEGLSAKDRTEKEGYSMIRQYHQEAVNDIFAKTMADAGYTYKDNVGWVNKDGTVLDNSDVMQIYNQAYLQTQPMLDEAFKEVNVEAAKAGRRDMLLNWAINGPIMMTLKVGLTAPSTQRALQNNRLFNTFKVKGTPGTATVTAYNPWTKKAWNWIKEPFGEFLEEYSQEVAGDFSTEFSKYNIGKFLENRYKGDGSLLLGDNFEGVWSAAFAKAGETALSRQAFKAGIYGALSSGIGTFSLHDMRTAKVDKDGNIVYKKDSKGNILKDKNGKPIEEKTWLGRGLNAKGERENFMQMLYRAMPWRSGVVENARQYRAKQRDYEEQAEALQEWLNDPKNAEKFQDLNAAVNWVTEMAEAGSKNDEFSYRNSKLGKLINDLSMLEKLRGTEVYNSFWEKINEIATVDENSDAAKQYVKNIKDNANSRGDISSDEETFNRIKQNATSILETRQAIDKEGAKVDKIYGELDNDTKNSIVYARLATNDWNTRIESLLKEISALGIEYKQNDTNSTLSAKQKELIVKYGSLKKAANVKTKMEKRLNDLQKLYKGKNLNESEQAKKKETDREIKRLNSALEEFKDVNLDEEQVMSEEEIMNLDPILRGQMFLMAHQKLYKERHNEAVTDEDSKLFYTGKQQKVLESLLRKGSEKDSDFLDKVVDLKRLYQAKQSNFAMMNTLITDKKALSNYAQMVKNEASRELKRNAAMQLNEIQDYDEFIRAYDNLMSKEGPNGRDYINAVLRNQKNPHLQKMLETLKLWEDSYKTLDDFEQDNKIDSNLAAVMTYVFRYAYENNISPTDRDAMWNLLSQTDENGYNIFASWFEREQSELAPEEKTTFTSLENVYQTYKDIINQTEKDITTKETLKKEIPVNPKAPQKQPGEQKQSVSIQKPPQQKPVNAGRQSVEEIGRNTIENSRLTFGDTATNIAIEEYNRVVNQDTFEDAEEAISGVINKLRASTSKDDNVASIILEKALATMRTQISVFDIAKKHNFPRLYQNSTGKEGFIALTDFSVTRADHPESSIVKFWDEHDIENYLRSNPMNEKTNLFFLTNSELTQKVKEDMGENYTPNSLPIIVAVEDPNGKLTVDGKHYQPIGTLPSTGFKYTEGKFAPGTLRLGTIREKADDSGSSLIYYEGKPLVSHPYGKGGGVRQTPKDINYRGINTISSVLESDANSSEKAELQSLNQEEKRQHAAYKKGVEKFLKGLVVRVNSKTNKKELRFEQPNLKDGGYNYPLVKDIPLQNSVSRAGKSLTDVINDGDIQELIHFNSRTEGLTGDIAKLLQKMPSLTIGTGQEELTQAENTGEAITKAVKNYIYLMGETFGETAFSIKALDDESGKPLMENGERVLQLQLKVPRLDNGNIVYDVKDVMTFTKSTDSNLLSYNILSQVLLNEDGSIKGENEAKWQINYNKVEDMRNGEAGAKKYFENIINDGIIGIEATSLDYAMRTVEIQQPFNLEGKIIINPTSQPIDNANPNGTTANETKIQNNVKIDTKTGAVTSESKPKPIKKAIPEDIQRTIDWLTSESKQVHLTEDGQFYKDEQGNIYYRTTTIQNADETSDKIAGEKEQFKDQLPSTNIGTTVDEFVRDFFAGTLKESYPNATKEQWESFKKQLETLKARLDAQGITIIPRDVTVTGALEVTDSKGSKATINVAGTLDLLAVDANGNYFILDMKTMKNPKNMHLNMEKWQRQLSIYKTLLEAKGISIKGLYVIPISVNYQSGNYAQGEGTQILLNGTNYNNAKPQLVRGDSPNVHLVTIKFKAPNIKFEKLSSEMQQNIKEIVQNGGAEGSIESESIETVEPVKQDNPAISIEDELDEIADNTSRFSGTPAQENTKYDKPVNIDKWTIPSAYHWNNLNQAQKERINELGYSKEQYESITKQEFEQIKDCAGL